MHSDGVDKGSVFTFTMKMERTIPSGSSPVSPSVADLEQGFEFNTFIQQNL